MARKRRIVVGRARPKAPEGYEGVEVQSRKRSGVYSASGTGLVTRLGSSQTGRRHPDRVKPDRPRNPRTAAEVERRDRRRRAASPRDDAATRAKDVVAKGGDPDAASSVPATVRGRRRQATRRR